MSTPNYENMKVVELRKELKERDLPVGGLKEPLIKRLSAADEVSGKSSGGSLISAKSSKSAKDVTTKASKSTKDITTKVSKSTKDVTPTASKSIKGVTPKSKITKSTKDDGKTDTKNIKIFKVKSLNNKKLIMIDYTNPDKIMIKSETKTLNTLIPSKILTMAIDDFDNDFIDDLNDPSYNDQTPVEEQVPKAYIYDFVPELTEILDAEDAPMISLLESILIDLILGKSLDWIQGDELQFSSNDGYFINSKKIEVPTIGSQMESYDPRTIIFTE